MGAPYLGALLIKIVIPKIVTPRLAYMPKKVIHSPEG